MTAHDDYARFRGLRSQLVELLDETGQVAKTLGLHARAAHLESVRQRLENTCFRLMVLGEFKRGKSTLVNAMAGDDREPGIVRLAVPTPSHQPLTRQLPGSAATL